MKASVLNISGEDTGKKIDLKKSIYGFEPNDHAIYLDVKQFMANNRQGTHKSKERADIKGSTRKIKRQKGTGTARAGSVKSPIMRGGGRAFGPRPKDYGFKINKKTKLVARKSALSYKAKEKNIIVLEDINFKDPKTSNYIDLQNNLKIENKKSLLVLAEQNKNIYLSSRNLKQANVVMANELTTYDLMNASVLLLEVSSVEVIEQNFKCLSNSIMEILIKPIVTEKMTSLGDKLNRYGFIVDKRANKIEIKSAVQEMFGVTVASVNTMTYGGKSKSRNTKGGIIVGKTNSYKKAILTLVEGDTIDFYSNI